MLGKIIFLCFTLSATIKLFQAEVARCVNIEKNNKKDHNLFLYLLDIVCISTEINK